MIRAHRRATVEDRISFVLMLLEGTRGPTRYGPDPKEVAAPQPAYLG